jgi:hypothetical protein
MKAEIQCLFESPGASEWDNMESLGRSLTDDLKSVRAFAIAGADGIEASPLFSRNPQF